MNSLATVATFGFGDFHPPTILALYRALGCRGSQYYRNEADPPREMEVIEACREAGLPIDSIHGVFGPKYDPSSLEDPVRAASVEIYHQEGLLARRLGGSMVVVHPAPNRAPGTTVSPAETELRSQALERSSRELAKIGEKIGVTFLIENQPPMAYLGTDPRQLAKLVRKIASPRFRMCFDVGHAHLTDSAAQSLRDCADVIDYLHIHDNDGTEDLHLLPGDGNIDWLEIRSALVDSGLKVPAMLEVFYMKDRLEKAVRSDLPANLAYWLNCPAS